MEKCVDSAINPDSGAVETLEFRMNTGHWVREMIFRYAWIWLLIIFAAGMAGLILGITIDFRWLICSLMIVCLMAPMLLSFLYYYFGLRREAFVNTMPHTIRAEEYGLVLTLRVSSVPENVADNEESEGDATPDSAQESRFREEIFTYDEMRPVQLGAKSAIIPLKSPAKGFIWIPASAFSDDNHVVSFLEYLDKNIQRFSSSAGISNI